MNNGTSITSLTERLKAKTAQDTQEIEALIQEQLKRLSESLSESSENALSTTATAIRGYLSRLEKEIASNCRIMSLTFGKKWLQVAVLSLSLILGTALSGWVLITLAESKVVNLRREIAELTAKKEGLEKTIASWPLRLEGLETGRFIIPTPPHTLKGNWMFLNQPAWKLE